MNFEVGRDRAGNMALKQQRESRTGDRKRHGNCRSAAGTNRRRSELRLIQQARDQITKPRRVSR